MAKIYQELKLDVLKANNAIRIQAKQNDVDSRYLKVTVTEDGNPIDMSGFTSVQINVKRDDGEKEAFAGEIAEGVVVVPIPSWALEVAGYASCDISMLNGEGEILTTLSFRLYVEKSNYKREITEDSPNYTAFEQALIDIESLKSGGGSSGGGGGFRKIGFTEDCDFVATEGDGLTAFRDAVNAASDGETFLVMPGVYKGVNQFDVVKNINFIGVGMPKIEFPVWISGGGVFNFESWSWDVLYPNVKSCWCGFSLLNNFIVGGTYNPDLVGYAGNAVLENCTVDGESVEITGEVRSCAFRCKHFNVGHYYDSEGAGGATLKDCSISATNNIEVYDGNFDSCEMFPPTSAVGKNISSSEFKKCKIFAVGTSIDVNDPRGSEGSFGDSIVFANSSNYGGYLVTPTAN